MDQPPAAKQVDIPAIIGENPRQKSQLPKVGKSLREGTMEQIRTLVLNSMIKESDVDTLLSRTSGGKVSVYTQSGSGNKVVNINGFDCSEELLYKQWDKSTGELITDNPFGDMRTHEAIDTLKKQCNTITVKTQVKFFKIIPKPSPEATILNPLKERKD